MAGFLVAVFVYGGWGGTLYVNEEVKHRRTNPGSIDAAAREHDPREEAVTSSWKTGNPACPDRHDCLSSTRSRLTGGFFRFGNR